MDSMETQSSGCFSKSVSVVAGDDIKPICSSSATSRSNYGAGESYMQSLHHSKGMIPQPPPPVAMSLRARESSSMALKQIFDQINNGGAFSREQEYKSAVQGQGFQSTRIQSLPDLRKRIPELDLSFRKALDNNPPYVQTGFGSPISTPTATNQSQAPQPSWPGPMNGQLMQHSYLPQAASSIRPSPSSRQPTAQMTIFYSGNVNVYDDVPADKAHAIMLLAGNSCASNFRCPAPPASTPFSRPADMMTMKESAPSPMKATQSQPQAPVAITNTNGGGIARSFGSPAPATSVAAASLASPPPSPAPAPLADNSKISQAGVAAKRPNTGIELPHARKASLARFLEKRKDRVQVQQVINPDQHAGAIAVEKGGGAEGAESASCSGKPDCPTTTTASSKRQCTQTTWSRSPSPSRSASNSNNAAVNMIHEDGESPHQKKAIINEHRFFQ